jgi:hypothetical protein
MERKQCELAMSCGRNDSGHRAAREFIRKGLCKGRLRDAERDDEFSLHFPAESDADMQLTAAVRPDVGYATVAGAWSSS